jgi:hypothetical protein
VKSSTTKLLWGAGLLGGAAWLWSRGRDTPEPRPGMEGAITGPLALPAWPTVEGSNEPVDDLPYPSRAGPEDRFAERKTVYTANGAPAEITFSVPMGPEYKVVVAALTPDIGAFVKLRGKNYGIGWGPPGSAPVLQFVIGAVNKAVAVGASVAGASKNPQAVAIASAAQAVGSIVSKIPDLIARGRVKIWTLFRAGKWGSKSKRKTIRARLKKWYSPQYQDAKQVGKLRGIWRFAGDYEGEWPLVSHTEGVDSFLANDPPTVFTERVGSYLRVTVQSAAIDHPVEIRYVATITEEES